MFLRGDYWHYDFIIGEKRYRGSTGFKRNEKSKALEVESKLKVQAREGHSIEMVWEQTKRKMIAGHELAFDYNSVWNAFMRKYSKNVKKERIRQHAFKLKNFCDWMYENYPDVKKISYVTSSHAYEWINHIRKGTGSNTTKNNYLGTIKMIFSALGKDCGIVETRFPKSRIFQATTYQERLSHRRNFP